MASGEKQDPLHASVFLVEVLVGESRLYYVHSRMTFVGTVDLFCFPEIDNTQN